MNDSVHLILPIVIVHELDGLEIRELERRRRPFQCAAGVVLRALVRTHGVAGADGEFRRCAGSRRGAALGRGRVRAYVSDSERSRRSGGVTAAERAMRTRLRGPFHPRSKMPALAAPPAGFEPAHTAPETVRREAAG